MGRFGNMGFEHFLYRQMAEKNDVKIAACRQHVPGSIQIVFCKLDPVLRIFTHTNIITYDWDYSLDWMASRADRRPRYRYNSP